MRRTKSEVGRTRDGFPLYKYSFIYENSVNWMERAQSHFTKAQKKEAKRKHKLELLINAL